MLITAIITILGVSALTVLWQQRNRLVSFTKVLLTLSAVLTGTGFIFNPNHLYLSLTVLSYWVIVFVLWRTKNDKQS